MNPATAQRVSGRFPIVIAHTPLVSTKVNPYLVKHGYIAVLAIAGGAAGLAATSGCTRRA